MRARILADAPGQLTQITLPTSSEGPGVASGSLPGTAETRGTSFPLDTTTLPDGTYLLKVVATDKPSNPVGALTDEKISEAFRVANRPPTLVLLNHSMKTDPDHSVHLEGIAIHPAIAIRGVQYRIDGGEWLAALRQRRHLRQPHRSLHNHHGAPGRGEAAFDRGDGRRRGWEYDYAKDYGPRFLSPGSTYSPEPFPESEERVPSRPWGLQGRGPGIGRARVRQYPTAPLTSSTVTEYAGNV